MYTDPTGLFASNMGSFGGANGSSGHGGGDGDGIKAYEGYDDEVPALFRFIHWCLGTTPDSIKSKNRAEHGRVCLELSKPNGDRRVNQSTLTRSRDASALDAELIRRLAEAGVDHNANAGGFVTVASWGPNVARKIRKHIHQVRKRHDVAEDIPRAGSGGIERVQEIIRERVARGGGRNTTFADEPAVAFEDGGVTYIFRPDGEFWTILRN